MKTPLYPLSTPATSNRHEFLLTLMERDIYERVYPSKPTNVMPYFGVVYSIGWRSYELSEIREASDKGTDYRGDGEFWQALHAALLLLGYKE